VCLGDAGVRYLASEGWHDASERARYELPVTLASEGFAVDGELVCEV